MENIEKLRLCATSARSMTPEEFAEIKEAMKSRFEELIKNYNRLTYPLTPEIRKSVDQLYALIFDFYTLMGGSLETIPTPDVTEDRTLIPTGYVKPTAVTFQKDLFNERTKGAMRIQENIYFFVVSVPRFYPSISSEKKHRTSAQIIVYTRDYTKKFFNGNTGIISVFESFTELKDPKSALINQHLYVAKSGRIGINDPINPNAKYMGDFPWQITLNVDEITDLGPCVIGD